MKNDHHHQNVHSTETSKNSLYKQQITMNMIMNTKINISYLFLSVIINVRTLDVLGFSPISFTRQEAPNGNIVAVSSRRGVFDDSDDIDDSNDRRSFVNSILKTSVGTTAAALGIVSFPEKSSASMASITDDNFSDLPNDAVRSYVQYRVPLKIAADYYIFSLQGMVSDIDQWGEVGQLFSVNNNKGQGQPSKIERDFVNPMRVLLLSFPPDASDEMRDAQFKFERAMNTIRKATAGYRRDLPVEIDPNSITLATTGWNEGRIALNEFFVLLNQAVGLNELTIIPPPGPNQSKEYGRSGRRYNDLQKKIKLCQNRGGPALSQAWGQLMVSGYLQDSCGIPDLNDYFNQEL